MDSLQIKSTLLGVYPAFIVLNVVLFIVAVPANVFIIIKIFNTREVRHSRALYFLANAAMCDLFKLVFVLPITLANLLLENFVFGAFLCYTLPMLQVFPIHTSVINYMGLIWDRYRGIRYPDKKRIPVALSTILAWILAVCSVMPYAGVIRYFDLGAIKGSEYENWGLCLMDVNKDTENYLRISFFLLFVIPCFAMIILLIKTSSELSFQMKNLDSCSCDADCVMRQGHIQSASSNRDAAEMGLGTSLMGKYGRVDGLTKGQRRLTLIHPVPSTDSMDAPSISDVECAFCTSLLQQTEQRRIGLMVALFIGSWFPQTFFMFVIHFMPEKSVEAEDLLNLTFTFIGFVSTAWNAFIIYPMIRRRLIIRDTCSGRFTESMATSLTNDFSPGSPDDRYEKPPALTIMKIQHDYRSKNKAYDI